MTELEQTIGYRFQTPSLLTCALTHSSYAREHGLDASNERLEFLGDAVLGFVAAETLYKKYPNNQEGKLTQTRAQLVCAANLAATAHRIGLGKHLRLSRGEDLGGGRERESILSDAFEALLAALYLDGGIDPVKKLLGEQLFSHIDEAVQRLTDNKTQLQELIQRTPGREIAYRELDRQGPQHAPVFVVEVTVDGVPQGRGEGRSKKEAEQTAAAKALKKLSP